MDEALPSLLPGNISFNKKLSSPGNNGVRGKAVSACRRLCYGIVVVCLLINTLVLVKMSLFGELADIRVGRDQNKDAGNVRKLAVVVPAHGGDLSKALASLSRWPKVCSDVTLRHVELILYYAGGPDDERWSDEVVPALEQTGGRCFARTSALFGNLTDEENVYPKGPSVQFYKLFLDETIRSQMSSFGAIAIIEWDVLVAHDRSFERLHHAAFDAVEPFWVKGSTLAGTNFHGTAAITDHWHVLGHINGNAIYNNSDPAFVEFIDFTLARWEYTYSYDVAIWATIADFPYSWPLWQRFSSKFVTTNLIANVGFLDVDPNTVGKALASETMFIHGSLTGGGGTQFAASDRSTAVAAAAAAQAGHLEKTPPIPEEQQSSVTRTMEASTEPRGANKNGGGDFSPSTAECRSECGSGVFDGGDADGDAGSGLFLSTVCDHSCGSEDSGGWRFGGRSCGAGDEDRYGSHCRLCYVDADEALKAERLLESQHRQAGHDGGEHVVMCDTMRPPESPNCSLKCATKLDTICDHRCGSGHFNDYNCNWRDRGAHCRFCFDDLDAALVADKAAKRNGGRVIMCNTHEPPVEKPESELNALELERVEQSAAAAEVAEDDDGRTASQQGDAIEVDDEEKSSPGGGGDVTTADPPAALLPYAKDLVRGDLCAFMTGYFVFLAETEASVRSLAHFMPGMRVRVAVDPIYFSVFNRSVGAYPEVEVVNATTAGGHASLLADVFCGDGTKLIYYLGPGEVISRTFTKKDTHGTRGDLLVPFTEPERLDDFHLKRTQATMSVLGFRSPSFSYGTDLFLPAWINRRLRHLLVTGADGSGRAWERTKEEEQQLAVSLVLETEDAHVPELLAGLAYSQNPPGIWFLNPQQWVTHHMFQQASVWDIPLVKPRFGCSTNLALAAEGYDVAHELNRFADSIGSGTGVGSGGSKCETGFLQLDPSQLRPKPDVEFGAPATGNRPMPRVESMRVSVFYDATMAGEADDPGDGGAWMLNATLPTVIQKFPGALEVVVAVGNEGVKAAYENVVTRHRSSAPFELRVVLVGSDGGDPAAAAKESGGAAEGRWGVTSTSSSVMPQGGGVGGGGRAARLRYPLLWADEVCRGRFVLHLDVDSVLVDTVTYDHVFHFGKPVIPFTRFSDAEISEEQHAGNACWRSKASQVLGVRQDEAVVHDFSAYDTHVYPVAMYPALRAHVRATEAVTRGSEGSLADVMSTGVCEGGGGSSGGGAVVVGGGKEEVGKRRWFRREMQYNLMASFMWHRMRGGIHWRAIDALDLQPDEWLTDPEKYRSWSCNLLGRYAEQATPPATTDSAAVFRQRVSELDSVEACGAFTVR